MAFFIKKEKTPLEIKLESKFELPEVSDFKKEVYLSLETPTQKNHELLVNFHDLYYLDSSGISALLWLKSICDSRNIRLAFYNVNEIIEHILHTTNVDKFFNVYKTRNAALSAFQKEEPTLV